MDRKKLTSLVVLYLVIGVLLFTSSENYRRLLPRSTTVKSTSSLLGVLREYAKALRLIKGSSFKAGGAHPTPTLQSKTRLFSTRSSVPSSKATQTSQTCPKER